MSRQRARKFPARVERLSPKHANKKTSPATGKWVVLTFAALLAVFTPSGSVVIDLFSQGLPGWTGLFNHSDIISRPGAGLEVLPPQVRQAIQLLVAHQLHEFDVGPRWESDPLLYQRLVEGSVPLKYRKGASSIVEMGSLPAGCSIVALQGGVTLGTCH